MISHEQIKQVLWSLNSEPTDAMIRYQFTGFVAGLSFALKERKLAQEAEHNLKAEWSFGLGSPGGPYGPAKMADALIAALRPHSKNGEAS